MLLVATLVGYAPVLLYGYPASGWDATYHAITARLFSNQFWAGDLYPRWLIAMNAGLGSPHFFYYSPLGYYIGSLFDWFGAPTAVPQLGAAAVLLGFVSGITCYLWLARVMSHGGALSGAIFYLASPFHVFVDLYVRADYAEFAAMTFTPLLLLGVELLRERRAVAGILTVGFGFAAVVLTHVVVGLIFAAVPVVYAVAREFGGAGFRRGGLARAALVLLASLLGLGISSFYLLPALWYRPDVVMPVQEMAIDKFMFGGPAQPRLILFVRLMFIGYGTVLLALAMAWRWLLRLRPDKLAVTCFSLAVLTMAATTVWTRPLWLMLPMLWTLQFTYRLFTLVDLCLAALIGSFLSAAAGRFRGIDRPARFAILAAASAGAVFAVHFGLFDYDAALWRQRARYAADYGLFRPVTVYAGLPADVLPLYSGGVFGSDIPLPPHALIIEGVAEQQVLEWRPRRIVVRIDAQTPGRAIIGQLYVPGWQVLDVASGRSLPVGASKGQGLLTVAFPAGVQQLAIALPARLAERAGFGLGILSVAGLGLLAAGTGRRWRRHGG